MRVNALHFRGYASGGSEFAPVFDNATPSDQQALTDVVDRMADSIITPDQGHFTALTIVGHSDRRDDDVSCEDKRASERTASQERAAQAWSWVLERVGERLAAAGIEAGSWWDTAPELTWSLVYASTGMLEFDPPLDEAQRAQNRRVVMLVSLFDTE
jgi:hypothetical protein